MNMCNDDHKPTVLDAMGLPDGHVRVKKAPCEECGNERVFGILADDPVHEGEDHMYIIDFLDATLDHCKHYHFGWTEEKYQADRAERQSRNRPS